MNNDSIEPIITDPELKSAGCFPLTLIAEIGPISVILRLVDRTSVPDLYEFVTNGCTQVAITVQFPTTGGSVVVGTGTSAVVYADTDGNGSITFYRSSPDLFDVEVNIASGSAPKSPTSLAPKPGVPSRKVKLAPKLTYPPPEVEDK